MPHDKLIARAHLGYNLAYGLIVILLTACFSITVRDWSVLDYGTDDGMFIV